MPRFLKLVGAAAMVALIAGSAHAAGMRYTIHRGPVETPAQNIARSAFYDHLLQVNPSFRAYRMRKECNPINFILELRQDCFASFDRYEPVLPRQSWR